MSKKLSVKVVVLALILSLVMPMGAFATVDELTHDTTAPGISLAGTYPAYDDIEFQYSITEDATHEITIKTDKAEADLKAAVEAGKVNFTLARDEERGYMDPELYPHPFAGGELSAWVDQENKEVFTVEKIDVKGSDLVVTLNSTGILFYRNDQAVDEVSKKIYTVPHTNGGYYLDYCGYYDFAANIDGTELGAVHSKVVPYDSYRTIYEMYDEIETLKAYNGDRYVLVESLGHSSVDGYDTPAVIVADDKADVDAWLDYTELSETNPTQVLADIEAGKYDDLAVPVYVSNCHTNENSAVNGILNFIQVLLTEEEVSLNTLEDYTAEGRALLEAEKEKIFQTGISEIYGRYATELGRLRGENGDARNLGWYGNSGYLDFEKYYEMGVDEFDIDELLEDVFFVCVPTMNMEGYENSTRATGMGYDPNRDYANQTMYEDANAMAYMAKWNPMVYTEIHGLVEGMLVEPCGAPHNPNIEYDLIVEKFVELGEAVGNAAVANNEKFNSYEMPARDYIELDGSSPTGVIWGSPWDDLSTNYGSQFPVFYGTCGITWEMPAYDDITAEQVIPSGMLGQGRYVQENKADLLTSQAQLFERGLNNENANDLVAEYYVSQYDEPGAQADIMRPVYDGEGENGNFYPECLIIPMDKENQRNLQDAAEGVKWIARNDMKYKIAEEAFEYDGVEYPAGTVIAPMYQAKRSLLNANFGTGSFVTVWAGLYSEAFSQHPYARGFDIITVAEPAAYEAINAVCADGADYEGTLELLAGFGSQFSGVEGADVIISNASEDTAIAVNDLLRAGYDVAMITEGEYMGDFICSYEAYETVADYCILSATGVYGAEEGIVAQYIAYSPEVFITGAWTPADSGYNGFASWSYGYNFDVHALTEMGFTLTDAATKADAIVGATLPTGAALAAVEEGTPFMAWGSAANFANKDGAVLIDGVERTGMSTGTDALAYVEYPTTTLVNANYVMDGDDQNYQYGTYYFNAIPEGATAIVKNAGKLPQVGCVCILDAEAEAEFEAYNNAVVAFEYQEDGMDIVAFANILDQKNHCTDEYKYIANFLFSRALVDEAYIGAEAPVDEPVDEPTDEPVDEPTDEPVDEPADEPVDEPADAEGADTGDNANLLVWLVLAVAAAGAGTVICRKKQN